MGLARHKRRAYVAHILTAGGELIAGLDCGFLRGGQLLHRNSWKTTFNHIDWHNKLLSCRRTVAYLRNDCDYRSSNLNRSPVCEFSVGIQRSCASLPS